MRNFPDPIRLSQISFISLLTVLLTFLGLTTTARAGHGPDSTGFYCSSETEIWEDLYYTQEDLDSGANPDQFHAPYFDCGQDNQTCDSDGQGNAWCVEPSQPPPAQCQNDSDFNDLFACNGAANHCGYGLFACQGSDELRSRFDETGYCGGYPENPACEPPPAQCQNDSDFKDLIACNGAANHCGYGLFACQGSDELRSRFDETGYCGGYPENPACEPPPAPPVVEPPSEPLPEPIPPAPLPPDLTKPSCGDKCIYVQEGTCYQGNCLKGDLDCGYNFKCGPVTGCSLPTEAVQCPDLIPTQTGTVAAAPIISSLTITADPPLSGSTIADNSLITVTANNANNTATRFEWSLNGNKLDSTSSSFEYRVKYDQKAPQLIIRAVAYNNLGVASEPKELSLEVQAPQLSIKPSTNLPQITYLAISNNKTGVPINLAGATIESGTELRFEANVKSNDPQASVDCRWYFHNEQSSGSLPPRTGGCSQVETFSETDSKVSLVPVHVYSDIEGHAYQEVPGTEQIINFTVKPPPPPEPPADIVQGIADQWGIRVDRSFSGQHLKWIYEFFSQAQQTNFMNLARGEYIQNCGGCQPNQVSQYVKMSQTNIYANQNSFITTLTHEMGHGIYWRHFFGSAGVGDHANLYARFGAVSSYSEARYDATENYPEVIAGCLHGRGVGTIYAAIWPKYKNFANSLIGHCVI